MMARIVVSFDFGWRFRLGATGPVAPPPPPVPPLGCSGSRAFTNASSQWCAGLVHDSLAHTPALCEAHCCSNNGCAVWQYWDADWRIGGGCSHGTCSSPPTDDPRWVGGRRDAPIPVPPPPPPLSSHPPEARADYNDSTSDWATINVPHDSLIANPVSFELCPEGCAGRSYIPRYASWYRKRFRLPAAWDDGSIIYLQFDGIFRETTLWLNGVNTSSHISGYTSFSMRIDRTPGLKYGGAPNVLAIYVDPDSGRTGWWYEGSGLYRHVRLIKTSPLNIAPDGLFVYSNITQIEGGNGDLTAAATVHASAELRNLGGRAAAASVRFTLYDSAGVAVGAASSAIISVASGGALVKARVDFRPTGRVRLWQIQAPNLYTVQAEVLVDGVVVDALNTSTGFRSLRYDANSGMFLNGQHTKVRGFCDHNDFGSFGMAVPDRIKLFRAQASRSVGGNGRRTSHNAPDPTMLDIYDRVGVVVMDENRVIQNDTEHEREMRALVARDRNHPSVTIWSFCNEGGCSFCNEGSDDVTKVTEHLQ